MEAGDIKEDSVPIKNACDYISGKFEYLCNISNLLTEAGTGGVL